MDNINSEFQMVGINKVKELFSKIYEGSGKNLDQYINGKSLTVSGDISDELMQNIKDFLNETKKVVKEPEEIKRLLSDIQIGEDDVKFIEWLEGFLYEFIRPYQDAKYLRTADLEKFKQVSVYVFDNMILTNINSEYIDTEIVEEKQIRCIKKIFMTFINRIICYNDKKEYIFDTMERRFGLYEEKCEIWWNLVKANEDRLWKIMIMRKMNHMEEKLNQLLEYIQE